MREEITPKGSDNAMFILALISYSIGLAVFITLCVTQAQQFITETEIKPADVSGSEGWSYQMISKVSAPYSVGAAAEPIQTYQLVNVMESSSAAESDLVASNPCASTQYVTGTSTTYNFGSSNIPLYSLIYKPDGTLILEQSLIGQPYTYPHYAYNSAAGTITQSEADGPGPSQAVGPDGTLYSTGPSSSGSSELYEYNNSAWNPVTDSPTGSLVLYQDNLFNLYYTDIGGSFAIPINVYSLTITNSVATSTLLFSITSTGILSSMVIYNPGPGTSSIQVYASISPSTTYTYSLERYTNGVQTPFGNIGFSVNAVDDSGSVYGVGNSGIMKYNTITGTTTTLTPSPAIYIDLMTFFGSSYSQLTVITSLNGIVQLNYLSMADMTYEFVNTQTEFSVQWFTCGSTVVTSLPTDPSGFSTACPLNGIATSTLFQQTYYFTSSAASAYATPIAAASCSGYIAPIVATVADLPPYSCQRKIYPGVFDVLSTAIANTELLLAIIIIGFGFLLEKLAVLYPAAAPEIKDKEPRGDVEMGNPMHKESGSADKPLSKEDVKEIFSEMMLLSETRVEKVIELFNKKHAKKFKQEEKIKIKTAMARNQDNISSIFLSSDHDERKALLQRCLEK